MIFAVVKNQETIERIERIDGRWPMKVPQRDTSAVNPKSEGRDGYSGQTSGRHIRDFFLANTELHRD